MEKYRRSDQYYFDEYDRSTIADLKEKESAVLAAEKLYNPCYASIRKFDYYPPSH
ncbi:hypothetical protein [Pedobacter rhizosphaerae]|uniref:Uncharacterized protein n=1 Tax=Pedobacter rhizosphaerae TaxID=390241 RepID=A0A1H9T3G7_9SPHI|nr:hypothetical protein [Pedobacter rhizosphaerae]SER91617.1 hypothetical protein SAMN04488023_12070 [Pedobacter rhizosphaerae]